MLCTAVIFAAAAPVAAQRNDDVVVMRRTIADPNMRRPSPTPTPAQSVTPTPAVTTTPTPTPTPSGPSVSPTPTPAATPAPSQSPSPTPPPYEKVATIARLQTPMLPYASANRTTYESSLSYSTDAGGVLCRDVATRTVASSPSACDDVPNPASVGTQTITATFQPTLKVAVIDRQSLLARSPELTNMTSVCAENTLFNVTGGLSEKWRVSCDPADLKGASDYVAVGISAIAGTTSNNNYAQAASQTLPDYQLQIAVSPWGSDTLCRQISTGLNVAIGNCSTARPGFFMGMTVNPRMRAVYVSRDAMIQAIPEITPANLNKFCQSTVSILSYTTGNTEVLNHRVRCDPDALRDHYAIVPTRAYPTSAYPGVSNYSGDTGTEYTAPLPINVNNYPVCVDTDTGQATPASEALACENLPKPKGFTVSGTFSGAYRRVLFNWDEVAAKVPAANNATNKANACAMDIQVYNIQGSGSTTFKTTCDPEDIRRHHVKDPFQALVPSYFSTTATYNQIRSGSPDFTMTQNISLNIGYKCRDTDTNKIIADTSKCDWLATPENMKPYAYTMRVSPTGKTITFRWSDLIDRAPNVANKTAFCSAENVELVSSTGRIGGYRMVCE